jgi:hypothetical protein
MRDFFTTLDGPELSSSSFPSQKEEEKGKGDFL